MLKFSCDQTNNYPSNYAASIAGNGIVENRIAGKDFVVVPGKSKILVVDDEDAILDFLEFFLKDEGFIVEVLSDGRQTMKKAIEFQPDLILHDIVMPGIDTLELCYQLKKTGSIDHIPIILTSASLIKKVQVNHIDSYIAKPFDLEELLTEINTVLRRVAPEN